MEFVLTIFTGVIVALLIGSPRILKWTVNRWNSTRSAQVGVVFRGESKWQREERWRKQDQMHKHLDSLQNRLKKFLDPKF